MIEPNTPVTTVTLPFKDINSKIVCDLKSAAIVSFVPSLHAILKRLK